MIAHRIVAVLMLALVGLLAPTTAQAHSELRSVTPADGATPDTAPSEIVFTFTDDVLGDFTQVQVTRPDGTPLDLAPPVSTGNTVNQPLPGLDPGTYTVAFRIVSADSHPIEGQSTFTVAPSTPSTTAPIAPAPSTESTAPEPDEPTLVATPISAPVETETTGSSVTATVMLVVVAAGLIGLFTWLARTRRRP